MNTTEMSCSSSRIPLHNIIAKHFLHNSTEKKKWTVENLFVNEGYKLDWFDCQLKLLRDLFEVVGIIVPFVSNAFCFEIDIEIAGIE